ncbi:hypothetical protein A8709_18310 [Paenibacillus pectinilyticus]|uniref:Uncharacterized protein n=1 Tax=Paenibacillus pectinilyticus TaxID=512399 RepID=A0A1C0ZZL5_9BACL|nr:hypothetical protein A8709_18310 [Paenibacillus pectinilyticus]
MVIEWINENYKEASKIFDSTREAYEWADFHYFLTLQEVIKLTLAIQLLMIRFTHIYSSNSPNGHAITI